MGDNEERFKTAAFGGFDKEEVMLELQKLKETAHAERAQISKDLDSAHRERESLRSQIRARDEKIASLQDTLASKDRELIELDRTIHEKYQSYVDNYDTIGSLVYEAKLRAKQINRETDEERQKILDEARAEADRIRREAEENAGRLLNDVQAEIEQRNRTGQVQYESVQEELNNVLDIFRQVQKQVMNSYRSIQQIASGRVADLDEEDADSAEEV